MEGHTAPLHILGCLIARSTHTCYARKPKIGLYRRPNYKFGGGER